MGSDFLGLQKQHRRAIGLDDRLPKREGGADDVSTANIEEPGE